MSCFSNEFNKSKEFSNLSQCVNTMNAPIGVIGLSDITKCLAVHTLCENGKKAFVITPDEASAIRTQETLAELQSGVLLYPARELTFVEVTGVSRDFEHIRLGVLSRILDGDYSVVVMSALAACRYTMPPEELKRRTFKLSVNDTVSIDALEKKLVLAGYSRYEQVDGTSQFAVRGGIIDIFPTYLDEPVRIEFWGDTIDTISSFDISTQRRNKNVDSVKITPANEVLFENNDKLADEIEKLAKSLKGKAVKAREKLYNDADKLRNGTGLNCLDKYLPLCYKSNGIFDYLDGMLFSFESARVKERLLKQQKLDLEELKWFVEDGTLCKGLDKFSLDFDELTDIYNQKNAIYMDSLPRGSFDTPVKHLANFRVQSFNAWSGTLSQLKDELFPLVKGAYTVCLMAGTQRAGRALAEDIKDMGYDCVYFEKRPPKLQPKTINILTGTMPSGFQITEIKLALLTHAKTNQSAKKPKKASSKNAIHSLDELTVGDYIVHNIHGIGIFEGIHALEINKVKKDYIKISYAKGDTLYVPVTQLDLVSKYIGGSSNEVKVKINRLGSSDWKKTKARVRESVKDMAKELIALYSKRMSTKGHAFSQDNDFQRDFELRFEYEETEDQLRCADEIKRDMERKAPMDRLLCGDVGFGKTEVAMRAVFKCVTDSKQCAILVPTTVLAMQHYQTALKRFEAFPIKIEMISRFVPASKQREILKGLENGSVDVLIGTHKLLGKSVKFRDLGLLIVDEEQRFGVAQKEKIKEKFPKVDVLTLSATPIPRTLNMAMSGIRDMSLLEEAPGERYPVQTYVVEYDPDIITEALEREVNRGGQCYYLHNNIETIEHKAIQIKKALPEARVNIAHGRMSEEQLSAVWNDLLSGKTDILVCTTIIETGVDVPNCNTLIIENADRMGLAQLHQIRGRVGRSSRRAYAYFTFTRGKELTDIATRRLEAIREYTEFGSGFKIAMRDLEIRGAGSLLGGHQHGHMEAVGYDMYLKLLEEAVAMEKGEISDEEPEEKECLIDLAINANIPENYIVSTAQRLSMYKRIAGIRNEADVNDVYDELTDRFGTPPESVKGLVQIALLRNSAVALGITDIVQRNGSLLFYSPNVDVKLAAILNAFMKGRVMLSAGKKPYIAIKCTPGEDTLNTVEETLKIMLEAKEHYENNA